MPSHSGVEFDASCAAVTGSQIPSGSLMPLPPPAAQRTRMHVRSVQLDGYKRADGRWDLWMRLPAPMPCPTSATATGSRRITHRSSDSTCFMVSVAQ
ncbi:hypothetical protein ACCAA_870009 [Candidatus Accumulibacter aalborgensis]|uniref:Uncharacterized protein n=1 Tax=Candidatus Accumulibacter aalborgensis TaxID=1860102 RepID=A0A1A8XZI3_9PROT|nr:hypothetical protein ACCAA_870009 [Candidatus Accumulibacter aalborgensis]